MLSVSRTLIARKSVFALRSFSAAATDKFDVVVVGGGPGGYVAAIKAAQLGLKTACIEKRGKLGGTCLNVGCIPSKALLHASLMYDEAKNTMKKYGVKADNVSFDLKTIMKTKEKAVRGLTNGIEFLFKKNGVEYIKGAASLEDEHTISAKLLAGGERTIEAANIILATGSNSRPIDTLPVDNAKERIIDSTGALQLSKVPKSLIVVGGGVIGLELGSVWRRLGAKVQVVEFLDHIGGPNDADVTSTLQKCLTKQGMQFKLSTKVLGSEVTESGVKLSVEGCKDGKKETLEAETVLVCVGRVPNTQGLGLEKAGVKVNQRGFVEVDANLRTNKSHIYAIGDIVRGPMLAHKAEEEGTMAAEMIKTGHGHVNYDVIPGVVYTEPEIAMVGKTEAQLKAENVEFTKGVFPLQANSRARAYDQPDGLIKVLADKKTKKILGVHMCGLNVSELIAEAGLAMEFGSTAEDVARTCHAHPTLSEAFKEACMAAYDKAIHF
ncbi:hypothetical protein WA538_002208 [Blastocystis sp. DL]